MLTGVTVRTVGSEPWRGALSDRTLKPLDPSNSADGPWDRACDRCRVYVRCRL